MKNSILSILMLIVTFPVFSQENTRIYEILDERTPGNEVLHAEAAPLNVIIYEAATSGRKGVKVTAYADTLFSTELSEEDIRQIGMVKETFSYVPDPDHPDEYVDTTIMAEFIAEDIVNYLLMEELEINGQDTIKKIIAIAPLCFEANSGVLYDFKVMFWVKMEDLDKILMQEPYFSYENRQGQRKFYHYLHERMFVATPFEFQISW